MRRSAPYRWLIIVLLAASAGMLAGCASARYEREWTLAGEPFTDTLVLSGDSFRLERASLLGQAVFLGRFEVNGDQWRFSVEAWKSAEGPWVHFGEPVEYVYRGRAFANGLAFYSVKPPRTPLGGLFIRVPSDFDIVP
jgi:hypothetical protein